MTEIEKLRQALDWRDLHVAESEESRLVTKAARERLVQLEVEAKQEKPKRATIWQCVSGLRAKAARERLVQLESSAFYLEALAEFVKEHDETPAECACRVSQALYDKVRAP